MAQSSPRKFAEKIALLNKKEAETNAAFERIIKEVEQSTREPSPYVIYNRNNLQQPQQPQQLQADQILVDQQQHQRRLSDSRLASNGAWTFETPDTCTYYYENGNGAYTADNNYAAQPYGEQTPLYDQQQQQQQQPQQQMIGPDQLCTTSPVPNIEIYSIEDDSIATNVSNNVESDIAQSNDSYLHRQQPVVHQSNTISPSPLISPASSLLDITSLKVSDGSTSPHYNSNSYDDCANTTANTTTTTTTTQQYNCNTTTTSTPNNLSPPTNPYAYTSHTVSTDDNNATAFEHHHQEPGTAIVRANSTNAILSGWHDYASTQQLTAPQNTRHIHGLFSKSSDLAQHRQYHQQQPIVGSFDDQSVASRQYSSAVPNTSYEVVRCNSMRNGNYQAPVARHNTLTDDTGFAVARSSSYNSIQNIHRYHTSQDDLLLSADLQKRSPLPLNSTHQRHQQQQVSNFIPDQQQHQLYDQQHYYTNPDT